MGMIVAVGASLFSIIAGPYAGRATMAKAAHTEVNSARIDFPNGIRRQLV
jgi:hypothetical protein